MQKGSEIKCMKNCSLLEKYTAILLNSVIRGEPAQHYTIIMCQLVMCLLIVVGNAGGNQVITMLATNTSDWYRTTTAHDCIRAL